MVVLVRVVAEHEMDRLRALPGTAPVYRRNERLNLGGQGLIVTGETNSGEWRLVSLGVQG